MSTWRPPASRGIGGRLIAKTGALRSWQLSCPANPSRPSPQWRRQPSSWRWTGRPASLTWQVCFSEGATRPSAGNMPANCHAEGRLGMALVHHPPAQVLNFRNPNPTPLHGRDSTWPRPRAFTARRGWTWRSSAPTATPTRWVLRFMRLCVCRLQASCPPGLPDAHAAASSSSSAAPRPSPPRAGAYDRPSDPPARAPVKVTPAQKVESGDATFCIAPSETVVSYHLRPPSSPKPALKVSTTCPASAPALCLQPAGGLPPLPCAALLGGGPAWLAGLQWACCLGSALCNG